MKKVSLHALALHSTNPSVATTLTSETALTPELFTEDSCIEVRNAVSDTVNVAPDSETTSEFPRVMYPRPSPRGNRKLLGGHR